MPAQLPDPRRSLSLPTSGTANFGGKPAFGRRGQAFHESRLERAAAASIGGPTIRSENDRGKLAGIFDAVH